MKVHAARVETVLKLGVGEHGVVDGLPAIGTSRGVLVLTSVQPAGKKVMPGRDFYGVPVIGVRFDLISWLDGYEPKIPCIVFWSWERLELMLAAAWLW